MNSIDFYKNNKEIAAYFIRCGALSEQNSLYGHSNEYLNIEILIAMNNVMTLLNKIDAAEFFVTGKSHFIAFPEIKENKLEKIDFLWQTSFNQGDCYRAVLTIHGTNASFKMFTLREKISSMDILRKMKNAYNLPEAIFL